MRWRLQWLVNMTGVTCRGVVSSSRKPLVLAQQGLISILLPCSWYQGHPPGVMRYQLLQGRQCCAVCQRPACAALVALSRDIHGVVPAARVDTPCEAHTSCLSSSINSWQHSKKALLLWAVQVKQTTTGHWLCCSYHTLAVMSASCKALRVCTFSSQRCALSPCLRSTQWTCMSCRSLLSQHAFTSHELRGMSCNSNAACFKHGSQVQVKFWVVHMQGVQRLPDPVEQGLVTRCPSTVTRYSV